MDDVGRAGAIMAGVAVTGAAFTARPLFRELLLAVFRRAPLRAVLRAPFLAVFRREPFLTVFRRAPFRAAFLLFTVLRRAPLRARFTARFTVLRARRAVLRARFTVFLARRAAFFTVRFAAFFVPFLPLFRRAAFAAVPTLLTALVVPRPRFLRVVLFDFFVVDRVFRRVAICVPFLRGAIESATRPRDATPDATSAVRPAPGLTRHRSTDRSAGLPFGSVEYVKTSP